VRGLDSDEFTAREEATRGLQKLGEAAAPELERALRGQPSPEARRRAVRLLEALRRPASVPERLRELRAVEALEHIETAEARLTQEAKAALRRLGPRAGR
jgi:hypothetical protein